MGNTFIPSIHPGTFSNLMRDYMPHKTGKKKKKKSFVVFLPHHPLNHDNIIMIMMLQAETDEEARERTTCATRELTARWRRCLAGTCYARPCRDHYIPANAADAFLSSHTQDSANRACFCSDWLGRLRSVKEIGSCVAQDG